MIKSKKVKKQGKQHFHFFISYFSQNFSDFSILIIFIQKGKNILFWFERFSFSKSQLISEFQIIQFVLYCLARAFRLKLFKSCLYFRHGSKNFLYSSKSRLLNTKGLFSGNCHHIFYFSSFLKIRKIYLGTYFPHYGGCCN